MFGTCLVFGRTRRGESPPVVRGSEPVLGRCRVVELYRVCGQNGCPRLTTQAVYGTVWNADPRRRPVQRLAMCPPPARPHKAGCCQARDKQNCWPSRAASRLYHREIKVNITCCQSGSMMEQAWCHRLRNPRRLRASSAIKFYLIFSTSVFILRQLAARPMLSSAQVWAEGIRRPAVCLASARCRQLFPAQPFLTGANMAPVAPRQVRNEVTRNDDP